MVVRIASEQGRSSLRSTCGACSFDLRCDVQDALAAIAVLPEWYRTMLVRAAESFGSSVLYVRTASRPWSPVDVALHVAQGLSCSASALEKLETHGTSPVVIIEAPLAEAPSVGLDDIHQALVRGSQALGAASSVLDVLGRGDVPEKALSASELVRRAAHEGVHHGLELSTLTATQRLPNLPGVSLPEMH